MGKGLSFAVCRLREYCELREYSQAGQADFDFTVGKNMDNRKLSIIHGENMAQLIVFDNFKEIPTPVVVLFSA